MKKATLRFLEFSFYSVSLALALVFFKSYVQRLCGKGRCVVSQAIERLTPEQQLELAACYCEWCGVDVADRDEWRREMVTAKRHIREWMVFWRKREKRIQSENLAWNNDENEVVEWDSERSLIRSADLLRWFGSIFPDPTPFCRDSKDG